MASMLFSDNVAMISIQSPRRKSAPISTSFLAHKSKVCYHEHMIELTCPVCNKTFQAYESRLRNAKYTPVCSLACLYRGRTMGIIKREVTNPYTITDKGRAGWIKAAKERTGILHKPPRVFICETCNKEVSIPRGKCCPARKFRFCSPKCANIGNSGEYNHAWRGGYDGYYGSNWKAQRRATRKRDGYKCQDCGRTQKDIGRSLDVHHIKRFADFESSEEANHIDNLISLCHRCHMLREWMYRKTT